MKYFGQCACQGKVTDKITTKTDGRGILLLDELRPTVFLNSEKIKGLVIRNGSLMCHGAVLAREYGIPCIVKTNAPKVKEGTTAELNASEQYVKF